jgi:putative nucleotidyltransferase with HDIG domain
MPSHVTPTPSCRAPLRVGLDAADPALSDLAALLPRGTHLVRNTEPCDVRLIGPRELEAGGVRPVHGAWLTAPGTPIVVIAPDDVPRERVRECFRSGAHDVLCLRELPQVLPAVLCSASERAAGGAALEQLQHSYDQTLEALVSALDLREQETADHSLRVALYALRLALRLGVAESSLRDLYHGALLHDIGKIGIPDGVLLKPGRLTDAEWVVMRTHTQLGAEILAGIGFLRTAHEVPLCHHEAWDGSGYPAGTAGSAIPLHARIFAVVDTYDALRSQRPYKPAHSHREALALLREAAGARLDPAIVASFAAETAATWDRLAASASGERGFRGALDAARGGPA